MMTDVVSFQDTGVDKENVAASNIQLQTSTPVLAKTQAVLADKPLEPQATEEAVESTAVAGTDAACEIEQLVLPDPKLVENDDGFDTADEADDCDNDDTDFNGAQNDEAGTVDHSEVVEMADASKLTEQPLENPRTSKVGHLRSMLALEQTLI